jgi:hypothetical protein
VNREHHARDLRGHEALHRDAHRESVEPAAALGRVQLPEATPAGRLELALHLSHAIYDGRQANNPWLQELPDPITKLSWSNAGDAFDEFEIRY